MNNDIIINSIKDETLVKDENKKEIVIKEEDKKEIVIEEDDKQIVKETETKEIDKELVKETETKEINKEFVKEINKELVIEINKELVKEIVIEEDNKELVKDENILKSKINTLCFSGGGVKGFSFIGGLEKLIEEEIIDLKNINLFVGTSAGALLSFLLNLEWSIKEIKDFIINFNFSKLTGDIDSINFFEKFGLQDGERVKLLFIKFLECKLDRKDITFKELFDLTNKKLIIVGTNLSQGKEATFSVDHTPDFSIILALRISCSIPIIFTPIEYNNELYVDGGIVNNFPINYCSRKSTIGFYVKNCNNNSITSVKNLILTTLSLTADTISEKNIEKYLKCVIQIKNTDYNISNFDINLEFKLKIIELGYKETEFYINSLKN